MDKNEKFLEKKEDVLNALGILRINLDKCIEAGMSDMNDTLYNQLDALFNHSKSIHTYEALGESVEQAKSIEMDIDNFLVHLGQSTISISWPKFD